LEFNSRKRNLRTRKKIGRKSSSPRKKLKKTNETLQKTFIALENYLGKDIDGDGKMGSL
jgi:hypothetical protein